MYNDTLKNRVRVSTTLFPETRDKLEEYAKKTQIPKATIIENAILQYISEKGEK